MVKIVVDHRERNSGIIKELIKEKFDVDIKQLAVADFILQSKNNKGKVLNVGIEKKTQNDFLNSIIDKRIITQLIALKKNFDIPILVIEGSENIYELRNFHPNAIRGMLASIAIDYQIPILHTKNYRDTASLLAVIARRLEKTRKPLSIANKRKALTLKQQQEIIIEMLPGIGPKLAKSLLKKFKTIKKITNTTEKQLQKIDKMGPKKARQIKNILEKRYVT